MRKIITDNYRVEVYPKTHYYGIKCEDDKEVCMKMLAEVRRHVDGVLSAEVVCDTHPVCEHCGYNWTEKEGRYNGGCCDEDEKNNPNTKESK